ncbi:MAG: hypothetical protein ACLR7U_08490 [Ruthenibacterium lactatiformans]
MSQKFTPLAQSRASYYCKGSPVHFVMVELFRMEGTGATVVTLTFKNLFSRPLVSFTAYFRCKNKYGEVVVEDSFTYDNVYAWDGECFGFDDAVFVSDEPLGSVEVRLGSVTYDDGAPHDLRRCPAVALPALRPLPQRERAAVCRALAGCGLLPEEAADGWRCTCGAFITTRAAASVCSECGVEKVLMQAAVRDAQSAQRQHAPVWCGYTVFARAGRRPPAAPAAAGRRRAVCNAKAPDAARAPACGQEIAVPAMAGTAACVSIMKDSTADFILRYMPFVTMAAAAVFTMGAVLVSQYLL